MKNMLLVVLLAVAATSAVVSNVVPDVLVLPDVTDGDELADVDENEMPEVFVTDVYELVDAADSTDVAEEAVIASRRGLSQGSIGSSDVRIFNMEQKADCIAGHIITRTITIRTNRQITAIRVTLIGESQNATVSIVTGGIGNSFVTIRIQSAVGCGFHFGIQIYGR